MASNQTAAKSNKKVRLEKFSKTFFDFMTILNNRFPEHKIINEYIANRDRLDMKKQQRWFRRKTTNFADLINKRDETIFEKTDVNFEWFNGINMRDLYNELDEKQRSSYWLYMNCFVLLSHPRNAELENSIKHDLQQYILDAQQVVQNGGDEEVSANLVQNMFSMLFENKQLMSILDTACNTIADNSKSIKSSDLDKILPTNGTAGTLVKNMFNDLTTNLENKRQAGEKIDFKSMLNLDMAQEMGQKYGEKIASGEIDIQNMMSGLMTSLNNMPELQGDTPGMPELKNITGMLNGMIQNNNIDTANLPDMGQMTNMLQSLLKTTEE